MKHWMLGLYEKAMPSTLSWYEKLVAAKKAGYDFLEMSIDETDEKLGRLDLNRQERLELMNTMGQAGIPVRTMCLSGHRRFPLGSEQQNIRERGMQIMEKAIQLADDTGIRIIQIAGYDVYYESSTLQTQTYFVENLKKSVEIAAKYGVLLAFETMETELINTVSKAMKYVSLVDSPYLQIYPDSGNITNASVLYKTKVVDDIESGKGHLVAVHLKETIPEKYREIPYGKGHVDFENVIKTTWEMGVRRYVAEFWCTGSRNWETELLDNYCFLSSFFV